MSGGRVDDEVLPEREENLVGCQAAHVLDAGLRDEQAVEGVVPHERRVATIAVA